MSKIKKLLAAISLLIAGCMVSYSLGYSQGRHNSKDYQAACHMSDVIRHYMDDLADEDGDIEDYGAFGELCDIYLWDDCVADPVVKLEDYVWCY